MIQPVDFQSNANSGFQEMLHSAAQMEVNDLERFSEEVRNLLLSRQRKILQKKEAELLLEINEGLPLSFWQRYEALTKKMNARQLSPEEARDLEDLVDELELHDARRLECLVELAHLKGVSLETLMQQLELKKPAYA